MGMFQHCWYAFIILMYNFAAAAVAVAVAVALDPWLWTPGNTDRMVNLKMMLSPSWTQVVFHNSKEDRLVLGTSMATNQFGFGIAVVPSCICGADLEPFEPSLASPHPAFLPYVAAAAASPSTLWPHSGTPLCVLQLLAALLDGQMLHLCSKPLGVSSSVVVVDASARAHRAGDRTAEIASFAIVGRCGRIELGGWVGEKVVAGRRIDTHFWRLHNNYMEEGGLGQMGWLGKALRGRKWLLSRCSLVVPIFPMFIWIE
ncbi:unnamed protein product [Ilex paraguariensis]|uniref:Uncharacterized protein n=1 Tax=Ilex paraguariensis TaxID=185542 RepID=A0ABC8RST5_9AQUA